MQRTNIYLDEDQLRALRHLAAAEGQSMAEVVREAIDDYLARRMRDSDLWRARLDSLLQRVQSRYPASIPPEEIEADISTVRDEVRRAHRAARGG